VQPSPCCRWARPLQWFASSQAAASRGPQAPWQPPASSQRQTRPLQPASQSSHHQPSCVLTPPHAPSHAPQAALALCRHKHPQETLEAREATAASVRALVPIMLDLLGVCAHYVHLGGRWPRPCFSLTVEQVGDSGGGGGGGGDRKGGGGRG